MVSSECTNETNCSTHNSFSHIWDADELDCQVENDYDFEYNFETSSQRIPIMQQFVKFLGEWTSQLNSMKLNKNDSTKIYQLSTSLIEEFSNVCYRLIDEVEDPIAPKQILTMTKHLVQAEFSLFNTAYKVNKTINENEFYVHPEEKALGTRYEQKRDRQTKLIMPRVIQSTAFYVPIVRTIQSLFTNAEFRKIYFEYNSVKDNCANDKIHSFNCGTVFKSNELFSKEQYALQIQLLTDDFELCNPLQSKAGVHKTCAVYFSIRNLPINFLSKTDNIHLVCLCNSNDLKTEYIDFNDLWQIVVDDISVLENIGVNIGDVTLKGSLVWLSADNLGANVSQGFCEGFNCRYYCRFCEYNIDECAVMTTENSSKIRTIEKYNAHLKTAQLMKKVDYKKTRGIKRSCKLNELTYFHMLENLSVDILHDVYEGAMLFTLRESFRFIIETKLLKENELVDIIHCFDYGETNQKNNPSSLQIKKLNLGQNGSQLYCVFRHLPFILFHWRFDEHFRPIWNVVLSLLRVSRYLHSLELEKDHLPALRNEISNYLHLYQTVFKKNLKPKQHNLTHYPRVIEKMGPVYPMNMLRAENKHKMFKDINHSNQNFINIHKTLATRHQHMAAFRGLSYKDEIMCGSKYNFDGNDWDLYSRLFDAVPEKNSIKTTKYFVYNHFKYKIGYFIIHKTHLYEIQKIAVLNEQFFFVSKLFNIVEFNDFFHSYEVIANDKSDNSLICFEELSNIRPYEKKIVQNRFYIMADSYSVNFE